MKRRKMGYKKSKRVFRKGTRIHKKNGLGLGVSRGGIRL